MPQSLEKTTTSAVVAQPSLRDRASANWRDHKVEVAGSGFATTALAGGTAAVAVLGGPVGLIVGLAVATLLALGSFLNTTMQANAKKIVDLTKTSNQPATVKAAPATPAAVQPKSTAAPVAQAQPAVQKQGFIQTAVDFVKNHPYKTALGAAAVVGAGAYAYAAATATNVCPVPQTVWQKAFDNRVCKAPPLMSKWVAKGRLFAASVGRDASTVLKTLGETATGQAAVRAYHTANEKIVNSVVRAADAASSSKEKIGAYLAPAAGFAAQEGATLSDGLAKTTFFKKHVAPAINHPIFSTAESTVKNGISIASKGIESAAEFCNDYPVVCGNPISAATALPIAFVAVKAARAARVAVEFLTTPVARLFARRAPAAVAAAAAVADVAEAAVKVGGRRHRRRH